MVKAIDPHAKALAEAKEAFDHKVESIATERSKQAAELSESLNTYLHRWSEHQKNIGATSPNLKAADVADAKHELAAHIRPQLKRLNFAINCGNQPTMLYARSNEKNRRGYFVLLTKDDKPLAIRADIDELVHLAADSQTQGLQLVEASIRQEKLSTWRKRIQGPPSEQKGASID